MIDQSKVLDNLDNENWPFIVQNLHYQHIHTTSSWNTDLTTCIGVTHLTLNKMTGNILLSSLDIDVDSELTVVSCGVS